MNSIERLQRHWTFYPLYTMLRTKQEPDGIAILRIGDAQKFFEDITKSLESIINPNGPFFLVDDLKTVIEALKGKMDGVTRTQVREYIQQIEGYMWQLNELKDNPLGFYEKQKYDSLLESCRRLTDFYTEENPRVLDFQEDLAE